MMSRNLLRARPPVQSPAGATLLKRYRAVRAVSESLCAPLAIEDYCMQPIPEVSPPKWHLAHTSWFFETFVLSPFVEGYQVYHPQFLHLFNSYYETVGSFHPRPRRGVLSRPTVAEICDYRRYVDAHMVLLLERSGWPAEVEARVTLGLNHEQQHQELLVTDIKNIFAANPLRPVYHHAPAAPRGQARACEWRDYGQGIFEIGSDASQFAFDNEFPRHKIFLEQFRMADRPVTNGEYLQFMEDGGYRRPELWLSDGWRHVREQGWSAPLYWERIDGEWQYMTLAGMRSVDMNAPVSHVSYYEAAAYAAWAGKRLPREAEWEVAARDEPVCGNLLESGELQPRAVGEGPAFFGDVWEWTQSAYAPYPGYRPPAGSLGEYNGKFMCNQLVLRGGSCATPASHLRATYRNFFYPWDRWQFTGVRLADDPA